jgi:hypothetical protein
MLYCEHVSMNDEHMNMNKWAQANLFKNILLTSMESFLTHGLEYFVTWPWMNDIFGWKKWLINKMIELFFFLNGCQTYEKSLLSHYLIHIMWNNFMLVLYILKNTTHETLGNTSSLLHIFIMWISTTSKPFRILNWIQFSGI